MFSAAKSIIITSTYLLRIAIHKSDEKYIEAFEMWCYKDDY